MEEPLVVGGSGQRDPRVPGDHVVVDRQDRLGVHSDPCNLVKITK